MIDGAGKLQIRAQAPYFGKQHRIQHFSQIRYAGGAAGASFESDDALYSGDVTETPQAECVFQVGQFFAQLI